MSTYMSCFTHCPKSLPIDLTCAGLWQFIEILDCARILEWHKCSLDEVLQRLRRRRVCGVARPQRDVCPQGHQPVFVLDREHRAFAHGRVLRERALHLHRMHPLPAYLYEVV